MPTVTEILASIGETNPGRIVTASELIRVLRQAGFPTARSTLHHYQMKGAGPAHYRYGGRMLYRVIDGLEWALSRTRVGTSPLGSAEAQDLDREAAQRVAA